MVVRITPDKQQICKLSETISQLDELMAHLTMILVLILDHYAKQHLETDFAVGIIQTTHHSPEYFHFRFM